MEASQRELTAVRSERDAFEQENTNLKKDLESNRTMNNSQHEKLLKAHQEEMKQIQEKASQVTTALDSAKSECPW